MNFLRSASNRFFGEYTPLHEAARTGNLEIVKKLMDEGANPNFRSKYNNTPLHLLIRDYSIELGHVVDNYEDEIDFDYWKIPTNIIKYRYVPVARYFKIAKLLIENMTPESLAIQDNENNYTPLHLLLDIIHHNSHNDVINYILYKANYKIVELLINKMRTEDFKLKDKNGYTILHKLIESPSYVMTERNEKINAFKKQKILNIIETKEGLSQQIINLVDRNKDLLNELLEELDSESFYSKYVDISRFLINKMRKKDLRIKNIFNNTPLHESIMEKNYPVTDLLVDVLDATDLNTINGNGLTPLQLIVTYYPGNFAYKDIIYLSDKMVNRGANNNIQILNSDNEPIYNSYDEYKEQLEKRIKSGKLYGGHSKSLRRKRPSQLRKTLKLRRKSY